MSQVIDSGMEPAIGRRIGRAEDRALLTGTAKFVGDFRFDGMLDVAFCRSQAAHATIVQIDTSAAASIPGVEMVVTADELDGLGDLTPPLHPPEGEIFSTERPMLARNVVRYVGEAVAMVAAADRYIAEDACESIAIGLESLPVINSVESATADDTTLLHEACGSNVLFEHEFDSGQTDDVFAEAELVIERLLGVPRVSPAPMESRAILAVPAEEGGVNIWYSTQTPYVLRRALVGLLGLSPEDIRVICPQVGGAFGAKSHVYPEDVLIPWAALKLGRPVRWLEDRTENLITSCHARGQEVRARIAADRKGVVSALEVDLTVDVGAYGIYPHGQLIEVLGTPNMLTGPYRIPELKFRARAIATNRCPGGGYRGVGLASAVFVHERMMDIVAAEVGIDSADIRRLNMLREDELPYENPRGLLYDSGDYHSALEKALVTVGSESISDLKDRARVSGLLVGMGLCCYNEYTGMGSNVFEGRGMVAIVGYEEAQISITPEGTILVKPTVPTTGQGSATAFAQIVADGLSLPVSAVEVRQPNTDAEAQGSGNFGSRGTVVGGTAMMRASTELRARLIEVGARELRAEPDSVEFRNGRVFITEEPETGMDLADLAAVGEGYLDVCQRYDPTTTTFSYGTHACVVEVDPQTGGVKILRYVIADDCGRVINPMIVDGQAFGSSVQGLGVALFEQVVYDDAGQPQTSSFADYLLPTAGDSPTFQVEHLETLPLDSPGGFRGAGEGGTVAAPPALVNALADAVSAEFNRIPVTPEMISNAVTR